MRASYAVANKIARDSKSFSDGEFITECIDEVVKIMCPDTLQEFEKVCLSRRTITRRIENINKDVVKTFRQRIGEMEVFSIACDESADISDTAQLGIFIRGVNEDFTETEELLALQSIKGTTKGEDIFGEVKKVFNTYNLHWSKLCCIVWVNIYS